MPTQRKPDEMTMLLYRIRVLLPNELKETIRDYYYWRMIKEKREQLFLLKDGIKGNWDSIRYEGGVPLWLDRISDVQRIRRYIFNPEPNQRSLLTMHKIKDHRREEWRTELKQLCQRENLNFRHVEWAIEEYSHELSKMCVKIFNWKNKKLTSVDMYNLIISLVIQERYKNSHVDMFVFMPYVGYNERWWVICDRCDKRNQNILMALIITRCMLLIEDRPIDLEVNLYDERIKRHIHDKYNRLIEGRDWMSPETISQMEKIDGWRNPISKKSQSPQ